MEPAPPATVRAGAGAADLARLLEGRPVACYEEASFRRSSLVSTLLPAVLLAGLGVAAAFRYRARRRFSRIKVSGGRKALVLYLAEKGR